MYRRLWGWLAVALLAALCLAPTGAWAEDVGVVQINEANFPDAAFRSYIGSNEIDRDENGCLSDDEIAEATEIVCYNRHITTLKGIEHFTAVKVLDCSSNGLTSLDVSHNTALEELDCSNNGLTALDVSANKALTSLACSNGNKFTTLDVSANAALTVLSCSSNGLTSLDVSHNTALAQLDCDHNELSSLVVSNNTSLKWLCCQSNKISSLDLNANVNLRELDCSSNAIGSLDLGNCPKLVTLYCFGCSLKELDVSSQKALSYLRCYENQLTNLCVTGNTKLMSLDCENNQIVSLDLSQNATLGTLYCSGNKLTSLSLNSSAPLRLFDARDNMQTIGIDSSRQFNLSKLPGFSVEKASGWDGGSVDSNGVLTVDADAKSVTYNYDCGANKSVTFKLKVGYVVGFYTDGGSEVAEQIVEAGAKATRPESNPTWKWHVFDGWYADEECTQEYDFDSAVTDATTVYAKWIEDADAPIVSGVEDGKTYCAAQKATVTDEHLASVTLDGVDVALDGGQTNCELDLAAGGLHTIVATDKASNSTTVTVTVNDGHTWGDTWSHDATEHWRECSVCGEMTDVARHAYSAADCVTPAICYTCEEEYGDVDPYNHRRLDHEEAKAATTEAEGNIEFWYCDDCGKYFSDAAGTKEIPASDIVIPRLDPKKDEDDKKGEKEEAGKGDKKDLALPQTGDAASPASLPFVAGLAAVTLALLAKGRDA